MTGRSVPEWRGASPDAAIPKLVRLRIWERCGGKCAITGRKLMPGDAYDFDHVIPLALGGEHRESNIQIVARDAHRLKTADDTRAIRKAQRIALKHSGGWPASKHKIRSRGFPKSRRVTAVHDEIDA